MLIYQVVFKRWSSVGSCCCVMWMRSIAIDVTLHALSVRPFQVLRRVSLCISRPNGSGHMKGNALGINGPRTCKAISLSSAIWPATIR
jgi:hypothetical protein